MEMAAATSSMASQPPSGFKCLTLMRHSIAIHNEAAASVPDAMSTVYLNEAYADARYVITGTERFSAIKEKGERES